MLCAMRRAQGTFTDGATFDTSDEWQFKTENQERSPWTGETIFIADPKYSKEYGTDQRRHRKTSENRPKVLV